MNVWGFLSTLCAVDLISIVTLATAVIAKRMIMALFDIDKAVSK